MKHSRFTPGVFGALVAVSWAPCLHAQSFGGSGAYGYFYPSSGRILVYGAGGGFGMPGGSGFNEYGAGAGGGGAGAAGGSEFIFSSNESVPGGGAGTNGTLALPRGGDGQPGQSSQTTFGNYSGGGGGGNGVALQNAGRIEIAIPVLGGDGGSGHNASGSGSGGYGLVTTGMSPAEVTVDVANGRVAGGTGGTGGANSGDGGVGAFFMTPGSQLVVLSGTIAGGSGGIGAKGGVGVLGSGLTVTNRGVIIGGDSVATVNQSASPTSLGGVGQSGSDVTITNLGTIAGGLSSAGAVGTARADAIAFTGGANSLILGDQMTTGTLIGDIAVSGSLSIDPGRTAGVVTLDNAITDGAFGAGALTKVGTGTLILTGVNTFTGGTTVSAGTLVGSATSFGSGAVADNAALVFAQPADAVLANPISGVGTLTKTGAGSLDLTGTSPFTGTTLVEGGTLLVDGSVANSTFTVATGTSLGGFGTVGGLVAQAGSRVSPGLVKAFSTLTVAGDVTFQAGSTYQVQIDAAGQTDRINASGRATIGGGTVNVLAGSGTYLTSQTYTLLTAAAGRTGTFAALTTTTNLSFLSPSLVYDANHVRLVFTHNSVLFPTLAVTANQRAAATGLQGLPNNSPLYAAVLSTSAAGARAAFDATSGEIHASAVTAGVESTRLERDAITDRLDEAARTYTPISGPFGALVPVLPRNAQGYAPLNGDIAPAPSPYTAWGTGFGDFGHNGGDGNAARLDRALGGFVLGIDTRIDGPVLTNWRVGVVGGYTDDQLSLRARGSSGSFETYFGGLYAGALYGPWDIKLGALGGGTTADTTRTVAFPGFFETQRSGSGGTIAQGFGELGYRFVMASGFVEPIVQGAAIHIGQSGFRESGGAAALVGLGHDTDVQTTTLGTKAEAALPVAGLPLIARGLVGWRHAFGDVTPLAVEAFAAGGPTFTVAGAPIARDAVVADAGLDYRLNSAVTLGISYDGQAGARANDNAVKGALEVRF